LSKQWGKEMAGQKHSMENDALAAGEYFNQYYLRQIK
jgi:hypothetical protein